MQKATKDDRAAVRMVRAESDLQFMRHKAHAEVEELMMRKTKLKIPKRIYALELAFSPERLAPPIDDDGTSVFMAWPTRREAEKGRAYQISRGYFSEDEVRVVRLK